MPDVFIKLPEDSDKCCFVVPLKTGKLVIAIVTVLSAIQYVLNVMAMM